MEYVNAYNYEGHKLFCSARNIHLYVLFTFYCLGKSQRGLQWEGQAWHIAFRLFTCAYVPCINTNTFLLFLVSYVEIACDRIRLGWILGGYVSVISCNLTLLNFNMILKCYPFYCVSCSCIANLSDGYTNWYVWKESSCEQEVYVQYPKQLSYHPLRPVTVWLLGVRVLLCVYYTDDVVRRDAKKMLFDMI